MRRSYHLNLSVKIIVLLLVGLAQIFDYSCANREGQSFEFRIQILSNFGELDKYKHFIGYDKIPELVETDSTEDSLAGLRIFIGETDSLVTKYPDLFTAVLIPDSGSGRPFLISNLKENTATEKSLSYRIERVSGRRIGIMAVLSEQFPGTIPPGKLAKIPGEISKSDFRILLAYVSEGEMNQLLKLDLPFDLVIWKPIFLKRRFDRVYRNTLIVSVGNGPPYLTSIYFRIPINGDRNFVDLQGIKKDMESLKIKLSELSEGKYTKMQPDQWAENQQEFQEAIDLLEELKILEKEIKNIPCGYARTLTPLFIIY